MSRGVAAILSLIIVPFLMPVAIRISERAGWYQMIRADGPKSHFGKDRTPTGVGWVFIVPVLLWGAAFLMELVPSLSSNRRLLICVVAALVIILLAAGLGFFDDRLKFRAGSAGLKARWRFPFQITAGAILGYAAWQLGRDSIVVPFSSPVTLGLWLVPLGALTFSGTINGVNFTDGQDGLAAGCLAATFLAFASVLHGWAFDVTPAGLLFGGFSVLSLAMFAACLAFLWYNAYPAQVFMGEVGSTTLGATLATMAILTGTELYLLLIGGVYVAEVLSVMLQVFWFRRTGKRLLKMSPLHHHFELSGVPEPQVTTRFWIVNAILCAVGVYAAR